MSCVICGNEKVHISCYYAYEKVCSTTCHLELHRREDMK